MRQNSADCKSLYIKATNFENKRNQQDRCFSNLLLGYNNDDTIYDNGCRTTSEPQSRRLMTAIFIHY